MDTGLPRPEQDRDALLIMIKSTADGKQLPFSAELRGGLTRLRFHFSAGATLREAFAPDAAACFETLLARIEETTGVISMPDFAADLPGVALRQCRATVGTTRMGDELISLRFRTCVGDALALFSTAAMPGEALRRAAGPDDAGGDTGDVLRDVLMPLFNLRQFLADAGDEQRSDHATALSTLLRNVEMQIGEIEDCYFSRIEEMRGQDLLVEGDPAPGVETMLAQFRQPGWRQIEGPEPAGDGFPARRFEGFSPPACALRSRA